MPEKRPPPLQLLLFLLTLTTTTVVVSAWKKEEFRTCNQTPFCKRSRSRQPHSLPPLSAVDVSLVDGDLTARLTNTSDADQKPLLLKISVYQDGILRFKIDEDPSLDPPKKRFEVPDVIVPGFEDKKLWLHRISTVDGGSVIYLSDGYEAVLRHHPFELYVRRSRDGERVVSVNANGLFDFEQLRTKSDGDDWEERFRSHTDTRPYGPQSITVDVSFYGADFVYGIPEHALDSLALRPTRGPDVEESEPYRLFNLDVFEYDHDSPFGIYGSVPFMLSHGKSDGKRYFTWDRVLFPNPVEMQKRLSDKGRRMVTIVDPHIKRDESFHLHKEATQKGYYVKDATGKDFDGWCWPGSSSYPDMLNPEIREWWADKFSLDSYVGSTRSLYIWNDMNEPSVFNGPEVTMPRDALHYGGVEHRELHNAYGYYFHMATANGLLKRGDGKDRPFVLSRAIFAGTQRAGAIWTGDNTAEWDHLRVSVPMLLTLGLTGISFSGADIGGFFGNPDTELLVRWYQVGAYYPFFRAHAHHDTKRREPWLFGEASVSGIPVLRPLWMEFPSDQATFNNSDTFLVGDSLLVRGVYNEGEKSVSVYLPGKQSWYDLRSGASYTGGTSYKLDVSLDSIPCFQRAGTIVPRKDRFRRSSSQMTNDPYTLVIALNSSLEAEGELYIDDGKSYDFENGAYIHRRFVFSNGKLTSTSIAPANTKGKFSSDCVVERVILMGLPRWGKNALVEPGNLKVDVELGPLTLRTGSKLSVLVIRKPNVRISDDWTITL
ncbi:putative alpha-xylosidase 2 [Acorus calamus]|uniref:Glucosidase II subunit alpha n=1 Tax=Acorus calamus TaxID=4465 RepID=A0AAV9EZ03_ACOCL|nr:putative alpha-xylosidase 2 [Acorus calamus]